MGLSLSILDLLILPTYLPTYVPMNVDRILGIGLSQGGWADGRAGTLAVVRQEDRHLVHAT